MVIQTILCTYDSADTQTIRQGLTLEQIKAWVSHPSGMLWVSLEQPTPEETAQVLEGAFHFHPLAIEDSTSQGYQVPKVDDFGDYLFLVVHALPPGSDHVTPDETVELNLFLGQNYLVTSFNGPEMPPVQQVMRRIQRDERLIRNGADFLCHAILDQLVDDYFPLIDQLDERLEGLEDRVLAKPSPEILEELLQQKHALMMLRRIIAPQREVINRLSRDEFPMIDRQSRIYYRDIYDHLVRIQDLSESLRDIVSGVLDIYLNSTSLRLNEVMKALTIVSTIFLPLSFVAGVYGMNFKLMPELSWPIGYPLVWAVFILIVIGMLAFFRRRNWF